MLEEVEVGVHSGPHTGWGGWLPPHCPPCTLPVPGLGVGSWGLPVTGCPLGIDWVTESLLDMGRPGGTGVSLLGLEDNPAQSHALDKRPRGQPQITRAHMTPRWRAVAGGLASPGGGVVPTETPARTAEVQPPCFPDWGPLLGPPVPFLCLRNPPPFPPVWVRISGPSLTSGCWSHQHSEGQSQG